MKKDVFMKRFLVTFLVFVMVLSSLGFVFANEGETVVINILHTNDIHSRVMESDSGIGYAKLATLINQYRKESSNVLLLDAGDTFHGDNIANLVEGESIVNIMNAIGYDAMTPGNHDFNYGQKRLLTLDKLTNFPIIGANILKTDGTPFLPEYKIFEFNDIKVGVFGLSSTETSFKTHPNNVIGLTFEDPVKAAKAMVERLKDETDIIIALTHLGEEGENTSIEVANAVEGIDLIVDGHSHSVYEEGMTVNDVLIVSAGEHSKYLGTAEIKIKDGEVLEKTAKLISKDETAEVEANENILQIITETIEAQEEILSEIIGKTDIYLDGERENVRTKETNLGNLVMDAFLAETGADIAMSNGGGIRSSLEAGEITIGDVITVVPFSNFVITKKMTGAMIKEALEFSVRLYPEANGGFLHVAGLSFSFDPSKGEGERVHNVMVGEEPLNMDKKYIVATHDFLAAGGDGYEMFAGAETVNEYPIMNEVVMNYIKEKEVVNPTVEGRITIKDAKETLEEPIVEEPQEEVVDETIDKTALKKPVVEEEPKKVASKETEIIVYIVQPGDWLSKIAIKYNTTWKHLQKINNIKNPDLIFPGQKIKIQ